LVANPAGTIAVRDDVVIGTITIPVRRSASSGRAFITALVQAIAAYSPGRATNNGADNSAIASVATASVIADNRAGKRPDRGTCTSITFYIASGGAGTQNTCEGDKAKCDSLHVDFHYDVRRKEDVILD
jgi:hypothetical protein